MAVCAWLLELTVVARSRHLLSEDGPVKRRDDAAMAAVLCSL